jgi:arylsulfatase A-like enzyme
VPRPGFTRVRDEDRKANQEYLALLKRRNKGRISTGEIFFECDLSPEAVRQAILAYDSEIACVDHQFGLLLDALKRLGLEKNTIVIFTSDHGESLGEKGLHFTHGFSVYESALRVPFLLRLPDKKSRGKRLKESVRLLDLMPTLLDLAGIKPIPHMKGRSLASMILGTDSEAAGTGPPVFAESEPMYLDHGVRRYPQRKRIYLEGEEGKWRTIRTDRYKLIMIPKADGPELELYDLASDPGEERDISGEQPETAEKLLESIREWLADPSRRDSVSTPELDEEWARRLKNIGYIGK